MSLPANNQNSASGLWDANTTMEAHARQSLSSALGSLEPLARDAYEASVEAPTIPFRNPTEKSATAALFLRRALVDFRAVWNLLESGYTSPAAAVAASLWEHALTAVALLSAPPLNPGLDQNGDAPWSPIKLAEFVQTIPEDRRPTNVYAAYKWLCKIKHPTLRSTFHDSGATQVNSDQYVVMASPDLRDEDMPSKRTILILSIARITHAATIFVEANNPNRESNEYVRFQARISRVTAGAAEQLGNQPLPFLLNPSEMPKHMRPEPP